jgi:hypothetical protein
VFRLVSFACMLSPLPRQRPMKPIFARTIHRLRPSPTVGRVGSCIGCFGACSVFTLHYGLHDSPSRLKATLYIRGSGSFVASAAAPIATGWSEPVPGRDFQPAVDHLLYTAHHQPLARQVQLD